MVVCMGLCIPLAASRSKPRSQQRLGFPELLSERYKCWPRNPPFILLMKAMEDDTNIRMGTGPSRKALIDDAIKFMSLKQLRSASRAWAKNLKLMAFDDSSRSLQMSRADARLTVPWQAICTRCEYNVRQQTEHYCEQHGIRQKVSVNIGHDAVEIRDESIPGFICDGCEVNIGHAERFRCLDCAKKRDYCRRCIESEDSFCAKVSHFPAVCPHVSARYCRACLYNTAISPFPSSRKIRNLRLIRQSDFCSDEFASCSDFFAVSYSSKEGKGPFTYQVRDLDGGTRENRVPDRVLDRAVAFAQENGFRFFWIYQVSSFPNLIHKSLLTGARSALKWMI